MFQCLRHGDPDESELLFFEHILGHRMQIEPCTIKGVRSQVQKFATKCSHIFKPIGKRFLNKKGISYEMWLESLSNVKIPMDELFLVVVSLIVKQNICIILKDGGSWTTCKSGDPSNCYACCFQGQAETNQKLAESAYTWDPEEEADTCSPIQVHLYQV